MQPQTDYLRRAQEFLAVASQFQLGELITEQPHPLTQNLSSLAQFNLPEALRLLHKVDCDALDILVSYREQIYRLSASVADTLRKGNSIYLCGCGATGRLSLACEIVWRTVHADDPLRERVIAFMAGGDVALISSIENFEDHPEYGARQLEELGFKNGDLLISCSEGGETPFVIGATVCAAEISDNRPYFLYCNPDSILCKAARRSADVIADRRIEKINLTVGPMALAGSTRMQASTALMIAAGSALLGNGDPGVVDREIMQIHEYWKSFDTSFMSQFTEYESEICRKKEYILYQTSCDIGITILTDTTERSPTFSMHPFENTGNPSGPLSLSYLFMPDCSDSRTAWNRLLMRSPRILDWPFIGDIASMKRLLGFDFSAQLKKRRLCLPGAVHHIFAITRQGNDVIFDCEGRIHAFECTGLSVLGIHVILKMILNAHSTLVMGRLGRYETNIMTWVRPSNNKLIDRTIRYARFLLARRDIAVSYNDAAIKCFECMETTPSDRSLVLATVDRLIKKPDVSYQ